MPNSLPSGRPLIAWYGDDFTGAAAVMEVLTFSGLQSVLFLDVPTRRQLDRFTGIRGIGVASTARTRSPEWMSETLPGVFKRLAALEPELVHYKVCSTLDSSPQTGSIGRAIEIASTQLDFDVVPVLIAAPQMRRYQCFGHLFAGMGEGVFRLDRHPVMSRHPTTPMDEADVARHIEKQSDRLDVTLMSLEAQAEPAASLASAARRRSGRLAAVTLDCLDTASEAAAGRMIWQERRKNPFVVGSQGVEYALVRHWQESGQLAEAQRTGGIGEVKQIAAVSGSVSPITADQIAWSRNNGFTCIAFDASLACGSTTCVARESDRVVAAALNAIGAGCSALIYTAEGVDDPAVTRFRTALAASGRPPSEVNQIIGETLGRALRGILQQTGIRRAVISGGDTSGHATQQLGIFALSALAPTVPGAAIFQAHAEGPADGLELALKGGQMGSPDYFGWVRNGGGER